MSQALIIAAIFFGIVALVLTLFFVIPARIKNNKVRIRFRTFVAILAILLTVAFPFLIYDSLANARESLIESLIEELVEFLIRSSGF